MNRGRLMDSLRRTIATDPWAVLAALVGVHTVVSLLAYDPVPHTGGDNAAYLALARSLLEHGRYLELWAPDRPPHTQYPPGFPALLAVAWTLGVRSWAALKLMMIGFSALAVGVSYLWMRERVTAAAAAVLGLLLAVAPGVAGENGWVLSDIPFWAATLGGLLALERGRDGWGTGLAFLALGLRTAGLPLVVAILAWQALRRRWAWAAGTLAVLAAITGLWTLRGAAVDGGYVSQFWMENPYDPAAGRVGVMGLMARVVGNAGMYVLTIVMRTLSGGVGIVGAAAGTLFAAAAAVGIGRRVWGSGSGRLAERVGVAELFAVLYVGMLLLWPEQWASDRFLIPLLPVLLVHAYGGVAMIPTGRARRAVQGGAALAVLGLATAPLIGLWSVAADCRAAVRQSGTYACLSPGERAFMELADWSNGRLPEDAVVISRKPRIWYWLSGDPGETYPFTRDRTALLERATELGARYVVLDELGASAPVYLTPAVAEHRRRYCAVRRMLHGDRSATLLGVLPSPWDPETFGISGAPDAEPLQVPRCSATFAPGRTGGG